jgi:hypothetical protein
MKKIKFISVFLTFIIALVLSVIFWSETLLFLNEVVVIGTKISPYATALSLILILVSIMIGREHKTNVLALNLILFSFIFFVISFFFLLNLFDVLKASLVFILIAIVLLALKILGEKMIRKIKNYLKRSK